MTQPTIPTEILEKRAAEQRRTLHNDVQQLRTVVEAEVHDRLDVKRNVSRHFAPIAGVTALIALSVGYSLAGIFTEK
jgi:hypothetical protein